ncbi:general secretion pathway protein GspD [Pandoraea sputorum]|uniref:secretin N-terminal domain-containing protein n=1 Tax=Pandoraea sputorum TaxID=93222 RepID=UPI001E593B91|nr:secretin N-terminal domain-containing protein [Pandoraea sputorum]MCE4060175.1 general secretion pathway protein GspD [Pandoraea sputorum]
MKLPRPSPNALRRSRAPLLHGAAALALVVLSGCAAQMALRDGRDLMAHDQPEAGLKKLQEASNRAPDNGEYRLIYLNARDKTLQDFLASGEKEMAAGKFQAARPWFRRALDLDPNSEKAKSDLRTLDALLRHQNMIKQASISMDERRYDAARKTLEQILRERPENDAARAMLAEVESRAAQPVLSAELSDAYRQPISIEFRDAPLRQVFQVIAQRSGLNFVFDKDLKTDTKVSIALRNSTVEQALYFLLVTNQLEQQVMDNNTLLIYPNLPAKVREYKEMVVRTFFLNNADAKLVAASLKTLTKSTDIVVDEKLNAVIVRDTPEAIRVAEQVVALQDRAEPEVVLDVEVLEIARTRLQNLGIQWPDKVVLSPLASAGNGAALTLADLLSPTRNSVSVGNPSATVNLNVNDGDTNILANPRIRVRNKEKAKILIGDKVPVISTTISGGVGTFASESVSYIDVGLTLNVEPTIYMNDQVGIRIAMEVSSLGQQTITKSGSTVFQIGTRQASTVLQLKDGENQVLAGLLNTQEQTSGNKIPGLGDFPIIGRLFGNTTNNDKKTEIVLSITPHIVRNVTRPAESATEFLSGTQGNFRRRPAAALPDATPRPQTATVPGVVMTTSGAGGAAVSANGLSLYEASHGTPAGTPPAPAPSAAPAPVAPLPPAATPAASAPVPGNPVPSPTPPATTVLGPTSDPVPLSSQQPVPVGGAPAPR